MFPFPVVNSLYIPWDFVLILAFLGVFVPWRGAAKMKKLLSKPQLTGRERLLLYGSTIFFQWLLVAIVAARCVARSVGPEELGLAVGSVSRVVSSGILVTGILCFNQVFGLRKLTSLPPERRGPFFAITERIMPRNRRELLVYAALACTAGISEEFLYRGFVFISFVRMAVNYGPPNAMAAILSSGWFAVAHLYQGRRGLITTFVVGLVFASLRLWTGSLIPAIAAHIGIDLAVGIYASQLLRSPSRMATIPSDAT